MAHPHADVRQSKVEHSRVGHITRGYATGGAVTASAPPKVPGKSAGATQKFADGGAVKQRLDRPQRAKGGRVGKTTVNVIVAPQGDQAKPPMPPVAGLGPAGPVPPPMAPKPPMMPPPGASPMAGPPGMPMSPRSAGGRTYATGGAVKAKPGPAYDEGKREGTKVTHSTGKNDLKDMNRPRVVTYKRGGAVKRADGGGARLSDMATRGQDRGRSGFETADEQKAALEKRATGGAVEAPAGKGPKMPGGGRGGLGRLAKAKRAAKNYAKPA